MNHQRAERFILTAPQTIRSALLDPAALPNWNPAIRTVVARGPAQIGLPCRITARGGLSGYLEYREITEQRIAVHLQVQGLSENGWWLLTPQESGTRVEHGFVHRGPLAQLLASAYRGVAHLRLDRLDAHIQAGLTTP